MRKDSKDKTTPKNESNLSQKELLVNTKGIFREIITTAIITAKNQIYRNGDANLLMRQRLNAPAVDL
jgi:hypothetical protein